MARTTVASMRKILVMALGLISVVAMFVAVVLFDGDAYAADRYDVVETHSTIVPGVDETKYISNNLENNDQVVAYAIEVDLSQSEIIAGYKDYDTSDWGMQTVRDQAAAAEQARGVKVVAAVNGDFYNMGTGEPTGSLVMNGEIIKENSSTNYFAVLKDGSAVIGSGALPENVKEAIGGSTLIIVDGEIPAMSGDYNVTKQPRTAIGIKADGNVVIVVADGRQAPYSSGYTLFELANKMLELGCVTAMNLDGGGSTTYLAKYAGEDELTLANSPADGQERSVSSSLLVVSNSEATGVFASAVISPDSEVYTPGSVVEFTARGADAAGFGVAIPDGIEWRLGEGYTQMGTIAEISASGEGNKSAVFTANEGVTGDVVVEMVYNGIIVGSATIELQWPDTLTMINSQFSLDFGERTDFGLAAYWQTREVHLKEEDLSWEIGPTGSEEFPSIGQMDGDVFVADEKATNVTATVTAKLLHNEEVAVSAEVSVGQLPYVYLDFEDVYDENGELLYTAEEYYTFGEGGNFTITTVSGGGGTTSGSAKLVDSTTGEVRAGSHALQINYDFTNANPTAGLYFGPSINFQIPNIGMPTAIGVWIYVPEEGFNFWLRTWFTGYDAEGKQVAGNSFGSGFGGDFNANNGVALKQGWNYIKADFSTANSFGASYYKFGNQTFRMMMVGPSGSKTSGYFYIDNFQFEYGANTDDIYAPEINSARLNGESGEELYDGMTISDDPFSIYASFEEFMGLSDEELAEIEDENLKESYQKAPLYATGVNVDDVRVYVDGKELELNSVTTTYLSTVAISLTDGMHKITIEVSDNFQNVSTKSYTINVSNGKEYSGVYLQSQEGSPYLGSDYVLDLTADNLAQIEKVSFEIKLAAGLSLAECTDVAAGFEVSECGQVHVNNNIYRVTIQRIQEDGSEQKIGSIAKINVFCPPTLVEGSKLSYSIESSEVVYSDNFQSEVINSFYDENLGVDIESYYSISADIMIVGSAGGYIYVKDPSGAPAQSVNITIDGSEVGITDSEGKFYTTSFVAEACTKTVAAYSTAGYSYGQRVSGILPGGNADTAAPLYVRSVATENGNTEQRIVWLSNPLYAKDASIVRYATVEAFEQGGEGADALTETATGTKRMVEFTGTYAVNVNQVLITGLVEDTEYVFIAGDGETWSEPQYFSTAKKNGETNFFIIGDTQEDNPEAIHAYGEAITNSGIDYDFAIQTGDFVDDGADYELWSGILSLFEPYFSSIDVVQVFGNHEYEANDGRYPEAMNYVPDRDYYSVTYGNVYVAVINIYTADGLREAMEWIKADAAKSDAVWKVLTMHRPPYYTNISGGSETAHDLIPAFVDEVGFDAVFSGHDHSYARTKPMTGGQVDEENGAVYFIVGAAESGRYGIYDDPAFNFDFASGEFNAIYMSVSAGYTEMVITAYNLLPDGTFDIFDTYTIRNSCYPDEHEYVYDMESGMLVCVHCHYAVSPEEISFTGLIENTDGENMFFTLGKKQTGWIAIGADYYYFDKDGRGVDGLVDLQSSYDGNTYGNISFLFENGKKIGGYTGWYGEKYYIDGTFQTGFIELDGKIYYLWTSEDNRWTDYELGQRVRGHKEIAFHTEWGWTWDTYFWFDETDGHMLGQAYDEDGNMLPGKFYYRVVDGKNLYSYIVVQGTGQNIGSDLLRNGWITASEYAEEAEGTVYYIRWDNMVLGDYVIDGVTYKFNDSGTDPLSEGTGALLGRYYTVQFVADGQIVSDNKIFQNEGIAAPMIPEKQGNSIKNYTFAGWYDGEDKFANGVLASKDVTYIAEFIVKYTEKYETMTAHLAALQAAETPSEKHEALNRATDVYKTLSAEELADMKAEGVSFALYETMLGKLYTVTFEAEGETVSSAVLYEGETIAAPKAPDKQGNSIKSYPFAGWFDGEDKFADGVSASKDVTYIAKFTVKYTEKYEMMTERLAALQAAGTPSEKHEALNRATDVYKTLSAEELADMKIEGVSFALYEIMLGKLYTVTFEAEGETVSSAVLYEGETISAPKAPEKQGNSIKSYPFAGWFDGEDKFADGSSACKDVTYIASYGLSYLEEYIALKEALGLLSGVSDGSPEDRYEALTTVYNALQAMSEEMKTDSVAEGLSFEQYESMLEEYNSVAQGAQEDLNDARKVADRFVKVAVAITGLVALAYLAVSKGGII